MAQTTSFKYSKKVLSMTMILPLLPPDMFQEALFIIQTEADQLSNEHPDILQFMSYLRLTWSDMVSKISTYRCPVRTNNIVESFHNIATQKLGTRNINVWTFLGNFYISKYFLLNIKFFNMRLYLCEYILHEITAGMVSVGNFRSTCIHIKLVHTYT